MYETLEKAFPCLRDKELTDEYIEAHPDPVRDVPPIPLIRAVPLYMQWCVTHKSEEGELVFDYTISALNKYARARSDEPEQQNFRFACNEEQRAAVIIFLNWCRESLTLDYEPSLSRAIRNWEAADKFGQGTR